MKTEPKPVAIFFCIVAASIMALLICIGLYGQQNPIQIDANGLTQTLTAGGVVVRGQIVKINSAGQVVPVLTTDTSGAIGVAATSQTSAGNGVAVSIQGTPLVQIDASGCAAGNIVSFSTTTGGAGHCASTASGQQVGVAISISSPGSNFWNVALSLGGGGAGGVPGQFSVKTYGAVGDAKKSNAVVTSSNATLTDATNSPWLSSDVGKKIFCINQTGGLSTLTTTISTITAFTSSSSITISSNGLGAATNNCVWFTQKETTAMQAAGTAAIASAKSIGSVAPMALAYPAYVYCPPGGYVVDGPFFIQNAATANTNGVSFIGAGRGSCVIYQSPDTVASNLVMMINSTQTWGPTFSDFTVDCSSFVFNLVANGMRFANVGRLTLSRVSLISCGNSGDVGGLISILNGSGLTSDDLNIVNGNSNNAEPPISISNNSGNLFRNLTTSNPGTAPLSISGGQGAGGPRSNSGGGTTFENCTLDEGGNPGIVSIASASVNMIACSIFAGLVTGISVDANSSLYITNTNIAPFSSSCSGGTRNAISITGTGAVYATGNTLAGCGTDNTGLSSSVNGGATSTFVDVGGNVFSNCTGATPCPVVTPATYVRAFGGGVVPKATVTHTPNTCYAVTGNLLATAQNLCTLLLDQNYQVVNATAQSGGTTPTNSSCATPPVITMSDGTRSFTMTMTTGKTQWNSGVDAVTNLNQVFATGTTLTVSIGANTCATPPSNVSVNYVLQSVLNP